MKKDKFIKYNLLQKSSFHTLGTLAFIGIVIYFSFLPQEDFSNIVTISPNEAKNKGFEYIKRIGLDSSKYKFESQHVEKLIGISQLSYLYRFCSIYSIDHIKNLGLPLQLYRIEYEYEQNKVILWVNPYNSSLFTMKREMKSGKVKNEYTTNDDDEEHIETLSLNTSTDRLTVMIHLILFRTNHLITN
jgi:hypothetical protein